MTANVQASRVRGARRGLAIYFGCLVAGTVVCEGLLIRAGKPITEQVALVFALMWVPALASIVARLVQREGFHDVSFGLRGPRVRRMLALAWLYPLAVGLVAYGIAWLTRLDTFSPPSMASLGLEHAPTSEKLLVAIVFNLVIGPLFAALTAAGEEMGWRGYMLTRLIDARVPRPVLVSGVIWACWHLPLILGGVYATGPVPWLAAILFAVDVIVQSYLFARVRLESGSIWPAVVLHSTWNALIQGTFDRFTAGNNAAHASTIWTGESGVLVVAVDVLFTLLLVIRPWPFRHTPRDEPERTMSLLDV